MIVISQRCAAAAAAAAAAADGLTSSGNISVVRDECWKMNQCAAPR